VKPVLLETGGPVALLSLFPVLVKSSGVSVLNQISTALCLWIGVSAPIARDKTIRTTQAEASQEEARGRAQSRPEDSSS